MPQPSKSQIESKLAAKFGARSSRTGGKCTVRRKFKAQTKQNSQDDKRLSSQLKKLNTSPIPAIEEVNLFKDDNTVIHFIRPRVQAEISSNTYIVTGEYTENKLQELIPNIIPQLSGQHIESLKEFANHFNQNNDININDNDNDNNEDDEDVPALVDESFEEVAAADEDDQNNQNNDNEDDAIPPTSALEPDEGQYVSV
eukprot:183882_1